MSNLISRYFDSFGAPKGSPARNKVASLIRARRVAQKRGEHPNVRKSLLTHIGQKRSVERKEKAVDRLRRLSKTQHKITISPQVRKKSARYAAQKAKSIVAGAGAQGRKPRGRRAELLKTHVNYA